MLHLKPTKAAANLSALVAAAEAAVAAAAVAVILLAKSMSLLPVADSEQHNHHCMRLSKKVEEPVEALAGPFPASSWGLI